MDVSHFECSTEKCIENGSEKSKILKPKIQENLRKNVCERDVFFDLEISWIWASFWVGFGRVLGRFWVTFLDFFLIFCDRAMNSIQNWILEAFWKGLGRVWARFWEVVWKVLAGF